MKTETQDGSDQRSEPITTAFLVNPAKRSIQAVTIKGYQSLRGLFREGAGLVDGKTTCSHEDGIYLHSWNDGEVNLEGNTVCQVWGTIYLHSWGDCNEFMVAPAWRTSLTPHLPMHGLTLIDAYDLSTGESVDCPISAGQFEATIEWEDFENRRESYRPNREWADKGGYEWSIGDGKGNIQASGSAWEEAAK